MVTYIVMTFATRNVSTFRTSMTLTIHRVGTMEDQKSQTGGKHSHRSQPLVTSEEKRVLVTSNNAHCSHPVPFPSISNMFYSRRNGLVNSRRSNRTSATARKHGSEIARYTFRTYSLHEERGSALC